MCWNLAGRQHKSASQKEALPTAGLDESRALTAHHTLRRQRELCYAPACPRRNKGTWETHCSSGCPHCIHPCPTPLLSSDPCVLLAPHRCSLLPMEPQPTQQITLLVCRDSCKQSKIVFPEIQTEFSSNLVMVALQQYPPKMLCLAGGLPIHRS